MKRWLTNVVNGKISRSEFPENSTISSVGFSVGGVGKGFNGARVVVRQSKIEKIREIS